MQRILLPLLLLLIVVFVACRPVGKNKDDVAGKELMYYSRALSLQENPDGSLTALIRNPEDTTSEIARYILIPRGTKIDGNNYTGSTVINIPVKSLLVYSSVHASVLEELGMLDVVKGVVDSHFFTSTELLHRMQSGAIIDAGAADSPSIEKIMNIHPDAILFSVYKGMDVRGIDRIGIPLLKFADNLETTPLGRAEWIRFIGYLVGREAQADSIFKETEQQYLQLQKKTALIKNKPKVLVDNMYQGIWYVSGGRSYQARLIQDAGGDYPWAYDTSSGSLNLSFEEVFAKAGDADIWLLKLFGATSFNRMNLIHMDSRYAGFSAVSEGGVWYSDTSVSRIFEETPFHPDILLKEYISIFHPELLPDVSPRYYKQMIQK